MIVWWFSRIRLDLQSKQKIQDTVFKIIKDEHKTVILVTHDISEAIAMSDRIIVLTARPAKIKKDIYLEFDDCTTPFSRRDSSSFHLYFNQIWEEMKQ